MHKKSNPNPKPRLVNVRDCQGDDLTPPRLAQELIDGDRANLRATTVREDLQAVRRRPLDAPMATRLEIPDPMSSMAWENKSSYRLDDVTPKLGIGRALLTLLLMATSFIAGLMVGRIA